MLIYLLDKTDALGVGGVLIDFLSDEGFSLGREGGLVFIGGSELVSLEVGSLEKTGGIVCSGGFVVSFVAVSPEDVDGRDVLESPNKASNKHPMKTKKSSRSIPKELMVFGQPDDRLAD